MNSTVVEMALIWLALVTSLSNQEPLSGHEVTGAGTCPPRNPKFPVLIPHPSDCGKFFICDNGKPHLQSCQPGLHFSQDVNSCDFPDRAGCATDASNFPDGQSDDDPNGCPRRNLAHPVYLSHPTDCDKFYVCDNGLRHLRRCESGLHFNLKVKACDFPERAGCDKASPGTMRGPSFPSPLCPPVDGKSQVFFSHGSNCSVYYMCSHGFAYEFVCPARLHFNLRTKRCDYEEAAKCENAE